MDYQTIFAQLFIIIAVLTVLVNIITEVVKNLSSKITGSKYINTFVLILSIALTVVVFLAYWQIKSMEITWYLILAFVVVGFLVAYAAMFGYDKLISYFKKIKE